MHPIEIIEYGFAAMLLVFILLVSLFLRKSRKKWAYLAAGIYLLSAICFFMVRPWVIDQQIEKKVITLNQYLEDKYPNETWTVWTVPHREDQYASMNPYVIEVTFSTEPLVHYGFVVGKTGIGLSSYWSESDRMEELKHWEPTPE